MTPKKKAKEIFTRMYKAYDPLNKYPMCFDTAKQCALVAVDEIMSEAKWWHDTSSYEESTDFEGGEKRLNYWQEVKTEIEKL